MKLQVAEDALRRAEGTYDPASSSNDAAARAKKHGAGAAMARLTGEAKAAGEEASRARHVLAEKRDALLDAASAPKSPVAAAAAAADEMDDADRALIDADARFQDTHALAVRLGDQHAAARLLGDAPEAAAAASGRNFGAPPRGRLDGAALGQRRRTRSSAPCLSRNRAWTTPRASHRRARARIARVRERGGAFRIGGRASRRDARRVRAG